MLILSFLLIEVHTLAVIGQQRCIVLRELSHNFIGTQGLELGRVRPHTKVSNLGPGKLQAEQEKRNLAQRGLHPLPSPGPDYIYIHVNAQRCKRTEIMIKRVRE